VFDDLVGSIQHCGFPCFNGLVRTTIKTDNHILARDAPRLIHSGKKGAVSDQVESSTDEAI